MALSHDKLRWVHPKQGARFETAQGPVGANTKDAPDEAEGLGSCCFASRNKNRVPQAEGDMTLRVWLGSKLECSDSDRRNTDCAQAGSERTDRSIHSRMVKLMAPAPPG